jgi:endonuclease/exonuclease/phosphatase family metal-dependent hydrolase
MHHGSISKNIAKGLDVLRKRIEAAKIPSSSLDETLNLATWNVREFGRRTRKQAAIHLIAEIMGQFDLISVVELRDNVKDLQRVLQILGPYWHVVYSDFNRDRAGNRERIAYVYDKRAVAFTGLSAEADPYRKKTKVKIKGKEVSEYRSEITWWRSPFMASFRAGDFDFVAITAHIRWDKAGGLASRQRELQLLAEWVDKRSKEKHAVDKDVILMGDFNIPKVGDALYKTLTSKGLRVPGALIGKHGSNLAKDKSYDQILHYPKHTKSFTKYAGVLDFYANNHKPLFPGISMTKTDFTYQLSDHLPMWAQLDTDIDGERLDQILNPKKKK